MGCLLLLLLLGVLPSLPHSSVCALGVHNAWWGEGGCDGLTEVEEVKEVEEVGGPLLGRGGWGAQLSPVRERYSLLCRG